jgi:hypothetical protein
MSKATQPNVTGGYVGSFLPPLVVEAILASERHGPWETLDALLDSVPIGWKEQSMTGRAPVSSWKDLRPE